MKSNKSKSKFGGAAIIYLVALLVVVLLYLGIAFPKLSATITDINLKIDSKRTEINFLMPYANQVATLEEKATQAEKQYEQNKELDEPVMFANILYKCADNAGVTLTNVSVTENQQVEISKAYASKNLSASIVVSATSNSQLERFVKLLEENEGSAMNVQDITYGVSEGAVEANATILMYTVEK